jgi:CheY-like chemotaxis protein
MWKCGAAWFGALVTKQDSQISRDLVSEHEYGYSPSVGKRILVIDDEEGILGLVRAILEAHGGWRVLTARSGKEGLACAAAECPDAILLDMMMPDLDGPAILQQLRANPATRSTPVILLTAKVQSTDAQRFNGLDVQGVISKPFDPLTLAAQISMALGWG